MKQFKWLLAGTACVAMASFLIISCQKNVGGEVENVPAGQSKLSVYLTDGPTDYQKVLIDIRGLLVKVDTCKSSNHHDDNRHCDDHRDTMDVHCEVWDTLDINPGVYDLLTLRNGTDTLLANGYIPNGQITKIKFILGTNNSVVVDSVSYPLQLKDNWNFVFVKIRHHLDVDSSNNNLSFYLDFDLARSIIYWNGKYYLKPVIRPFSRKSFGEIEGKIRPVHSFGTVMAYNNSDTAWARPWQKEGEFKIRGLQEGTYNLYIDGINGYKDTTITNIQVKRGKDTELGMITLKK